MAPARAQVRQELGPKYGPYAEATFLGLMLHVIDELVHHGTAEVSLLATSTERLPPGKRCKGESRSTTTDTLYGWARGGWTTSRRGTPHRAGLPPDAADAVTINGGDPVARARFLLVECGGRARAVAAAAALIGETPPASRADDHRRHPDAPATSLLNFVFQQLLDGETPQRVADNPLIALYDVATGALHLHGAFRGSPIRPGA